MRPVILLPLMLALGTAPVRAEDAPIPPEPPAKPAPAVKKKPATIIMSDPAQGRTVGVLGGDPVVLQKTPNGTVGKTGDTPILTHKDDQGNTFGKVGDKTLFCHSDPATGITICK